MASDLWISGIEPESIVDGPGFRYVIFTQGCPHHCPGCHNPQTHPFTGGKKADIPAILREIEEDPILQGVTFSGGEPFCQPEPLCQIAQAVKAMGKDVTAFSGYTLEQLVERVEWAGVVGMGGGAFPTWEKLFRSAGKIDTLIINAAECEPYVTADYRLLLERGEHILRGAQVLARCLGCERVVLVTEGDKLSAVEAVERRLRRQHGGRVQILTVRTRYPLGAEKQIIQTVTGREVPPGGSPLHVKCAVFNVATVYAIHEALFQGRPLTHRAVTVTGGAVTRPRNLWVPIGTPLRHLLDACGGLREEADRMLTGGPMMGVALQNLDAPVIKDTNSLVCLTDWEHKPDTPAGVCIRCGKCVASCPMHLAPTFVRRALEDGDLKRLSKYHLEDCNACGCCSFICPAQIPLVETIAQARGLLKREGAVQ